MIIKYDFSQKDIDCALVNFYNRLVTEFNRGECISWTPSFYPYMVSELVAAILIRGKHYNEKIHRIKDLASLTSGNYSSIFNAILNVGFNRADAVKNKGYALNQLDGSAKQTNMDVWRFYNDVAAKFELGRKIPKHQFYCAIELLPSLIYNCLSFSSNVPLTYRKIVSLAENKYFYISQILSLVNVGVSEFGDQIDLDLVV